MTAQIVILNKLCAGVSSDSSVTLSGRDGPKRTFPTAEKILPLPPPHNIVVLHGGATELLGVPYSVFLGEWMQALPDSPLEKVLDYRTNLEAWVIAQGDLFAKDAQDEYLHWIVRDYLLAVRRDLLKRCQETGLEEGDWNSTQAASIVEEVISSSLEYLGNRPYLRGWEDVDCGAILRAHDDLFKETMEWVFDDTPRTETGDDGLKELTETLLAVYEEYSRDAVLTIVGYGADELFPASEKVIFQGIIDGRLRVGPIDSTSITVDMSSSIIPLGQTEAVHTFLRAYNPAFLSKAHERLGSVVDKVREIVGAEPAVLSKMEELEATGHEELDSDFEALSWGEFLQPMVDTVAGLPPAEVARMAEALVGLQVLRQLTQADAETVGGPIDVAIVTRHDGVRWIRHK